MYQKPATVVTYFRSL